MNFAPLDRVRCELRPGDVLVCEGGEVGRAAVWNGELDNCYFQKAIHRVRPRRGANSRYLMYCLRAAAKRSVFAVEGNLSTIVHLTGEQLRVHRFPWPSDTEQIEIVARLDEAAVAHTEATRCLAGQLDLLLERRHALITAAVMGELTVPGVAA
jgi:type I restriction enzyme S subunit